MNWPFDDGSDLPLRDGFDVGGAQERKMASMVGGYSGIRTVEELNPDGSITILRTRGGRPIFETTAVRRSSQAQKYRGFVAKIPSRAVLFDPYTLDILDANYQPAVNTYSVQDFATNWNVPAADDTDWYDVVLFDGSTIKVNAKAMPTLGITANHGYPAIPYVINRNTAEDQYGNAERNATEKRVFAVGRYSVTSWGGGVVTETLTPSAPRDDNKAMTIGQRVDAATDKAYLAQLYYTGYDWDDSYGSWQYSSSDMLMQMVYPYLSKTSSSATVELPAPILTTTSTAPSNLSTPVQFPSTHVAYTGAGVVSGTKFNFPPPQTSNTRRINYPASSVVWSEVPGTLERSSTITIFTATASVTQNFSGTQIDFALENTKTFDDGTEYKKQPSQELTINTDPLQNNSQDVLFAPTSTSLDWTAGGLNPTRGRETAEIPHQNFSSYSRNYGQQSCSCSVSSPTAGDLVTVAIAQSKTTGKLSTLTPNAYYDLFVESAAIAEVFGTIILKHDVNLWEYKTPQDAGVYAEINAEADARAAAYSNILLYYSVRRDALGTQFYNQTLSDDNSIVASITWTSRDFLLNDAINGVVVTVEGAYIGSQSVLETASATLEVTLKIVTRHHTTVITIGEFAYTYTELLPEKNIYGTSKAAVPTPQIRAIFAPMFQEQGSFKGAHYVTAEEESNGATPAHLFNFVLYPEPYGAIGTLNATNEEGHAIHFVPCNLLEMLYAFVFSQEYGVAEDGTRYPVTFTARYNDMMSTLFSSAYRVSVRDGVQGNWSDSLGADFASISTVSLHRT